MSKKEEVEDRGDVYIPEDELDELEDEELEELDEEDEDEDEEIDEEDSEDDDEEEDTEDEVEDEEESSDDEMEDEEEDEEEEEQRIPKGRLNQVLSQRDQEREENRWLREQLEALISQRKEEDSEEDEEDPAPPEYDFDAAEQAYINKILEGEVEEAAKIRKEINKAAAAERDYQIDYARKTAKREAVDETTNTIDDARFNTLLNSYVEEYSFLNDESEEYNEKAVTMANNLMASYVNSGMPKSKALERAVEDILPFYKKEEEEVDKKKTTVDSRKRTARKKAAKASQAQPPSPKKRSRKASRDLDGLSIDKMSEKVFNSLTAKEKAKLRGDIV